MKAWIKSQLFVRGITDDRILSVMDKVPRDEFVPDDFKSQAYADRALPIGFDQTISQPYIVAYMSNLAIAQQGKKVLEIGTGSGYQAAILAELFPEVHTLEIIEPLHIQTKNLLKKLGYNNISTHLADGYLGWKAAAPYSVIILTAAPKEIPKVLFSQLEEEGCLIAPQGTEHSQTIMKYEKHSSKIIQKEFISVLFVPMVSQDR